MEKQWLTSPALFALQGNAALLTPISFPHFWDWMLVHTGLCPATRQQLVRQTQRTVPIHIACWLPNRQVLLDGQFKHCQVGTGGAAPETGHRGIVLPWFCF